MTQSRHPEVVRVLAGILLLVTLTTGLGVRGALAAVLTIAVLAVLPPIYGFAVGQLAVASLAPPTRSILLATPSVLGAELALFLALWSDLTTPADRDLLPVLIVTTGLLAVVAGVTIGETESLWATGGVLLGSLVLLAYALHRYTTVFVLEEATP